jgi:DNA-directed RNA polymerase specialized sigma24 family protein
MVAVQINLENQKEKTMRQNRTGRNHRTTYIYYDVNEKKVVELKPGDNGVTEAHIALLHQADDDEYNAGRREDYHIPVHYDAYENEIGESATDQNAYLADGRLSPETSLIAEVDRSEFSEIWNALEPGQRELAMKKLQGQSNSFIAAEEGVTEAAIRNRLKKIQNKFKKIV